MTRPPRTVQIDSARTIELDGGWRATVCIDPEGNESLWLASPTPDQFAGCSCRTCAPHDQLGHTPTRTRTTDSARTEA